MALDPSGIDQNFTPMELFMAYHSATPAQSDIWYFDTGATHHMTHQQSWLSDFQELATPFNVFLGDDSHYRALGHGKIIIQLPDGRFTQIKEVYYVPGLTKNLLSVSAATANGSSIEFHHDHCIIKVHLTNGDIIRLTCKQQGRLYPLGVTMVPSQALSSVSQTTSELETLRWHYRLGHPHVRVITTMQRRNLATGLHFRPSPIAICEGCLYGKSAHQPFPRSTSRSFYPLQLVHSDLCGPMPDVPSQVPSIS